MTEHKKSGYQKIVALLEKFTKNTGLWLGLFLLLFIAGNSLFFTSWFDIPNTAEHVLYATGGWLWNLLALAAFTALTALILHTKLWQHRLAKWVPWLLFLFYLILGTLWVLGAGARQYGEPERINLSAVAFMQGEYSHLLEGGYNYMFPFQLGFTLYIEGVYHLFGEYNMNAVSFLNVLYAAGCYLLIVKIARRLFPASPVAFLTALFAFLSVYLVPYTTFNYAILPGLFFALLGLYLALRYIQSHRYGRLGGCIAATALATILKSNYLIFAIAIGILLVFDTLKRPGAAAIALTALFILSNLFGMQGVYAIYALRSGHPIGSGVPQLVWVAMGMKDDGELAPGWYNGDTYTTYPATGYDTEATNQIAREAIADALSGFAKAPASAATFFYKKIMSEWNEPTWGSFMATWYAIDYGGGGGWVRRFFVGGTWANATLWLMARVHFLTMAGASFGLWVRRKSLTLSQCIPAIALIGGFLFFLVWEGKSQYVMPYAFLLLPYAALGFSALPSALKAIFHRLKQKGAIRKV